jgi:hypothetical protein
VAPQGAAVQLAVRLQDASQVEASLPGVAQGAALALLAPVALTSVAAAALPQAGAYSPR